MGRKSKRMTTEGGIANDILAYCPECDRLHKATLKISRNGKKRYVGSRCGCLIKKQT